MQRHPLHEDLVVQDLLAQAEHIDGKDRQQREHKVLDARAVHAGRAPQCRFEVEEHDTRDE